MRQIETKMPSFLSNKKIKAFGLDISDNSIKIMQLDQTKNGFKPSVFANSALSDKVISNHMIINEKRLADNISDALLRAVGLTTKFVVCSVPEAKSFVRTLTIQKMSDSEIDSSVPFEIEQEIPIPVDQVYLDWQINREVGGKLELLVMATPKDYMDSLVKCLRLAKLVPVAMELESQATARAVIGAADLKNNVLIIDVATNQTSFIIADSGVIEYTSSIPIAGNALTASIARELNVALSAAEDLKRASGLVIDTKQGNIRKVLLPVVDNIVDEAKNVMRFFEEHDPAHKSIQTVLLCGGSARLLGLVDYFSTRINLGSSRPPIRVVLGDPWVNVFSHTAEGAVPLTPFDALGYTTVIGLALRGANLTDY
ncbi:MAG: type IV pilus assembly protein PilM [Candidatus Doudnabacteria bacterium]